MLALLLSLIPAQEVDPGSVAFIELQTTPARIWVEQPFTVRIRFGFERAFAEERLIELFRRSLDVPAQVQADWLDDLDGAEELDAFHPPTLGERPRSFALGDDVAHATLVEEERAGRPFSVLSIERTLVVARAAALTLPGPLLRFRYATTFDEDLFGDRAPRGVRDAQVVAEPRTLDVRRWPEEDRPFDFTGAIGAFELAVLVEPRELAVGEALSVVLTIQGRGNLGRFDPPRYEPEGFALRGRTLESRSDALIVRLDLEPLRLVDELPAITFPTLDPETGTYRRLRTEPVPLTVRAAPSTRPSPPPPAHPPAPDADAAPDRSRVALVVVPLGAAFALVGIWLWLRSRSAGRTVRPSEPSERVVRARRSVEAALSKEGGDRALEASFTEYLAAVLDVAPAAVAGRDLVGRLAGRGLSAALAERLVVAYDDVVHAHWGGSAEGPDGAGIGRLLGEVEAALREGGGSTS